MKKVKSLIINVNEINLNQRKFTTSEIGRGVGIQPAGKGRGSYNRNNKHKKKWPVEGIWSDRKNGIGLFIFG